MIRVDSESVVTRGRAGYRTEVPKPALSLPPPLPGWVAVSTIQSIRSEVPYGPYGGPYGQPLIFAIVSIRQSTARRMGLDVKFF